MIPLLVGALLGAAVGSFLNVVIHRLPRNESVVTPPSRCYACGTRVAWYDNLPVLSWCILRGRCRWCGSRFSVRYAIGEAMVAAISAGICWFAFVVLAPVLRPELHAAAWVLPPPWAAAAAAAALLVLAWYLWASALIDAAHTIIPDELTKPMQVAAPLLAPLVPVAMAFGWHPGPWFVSDRLDGPVLAPLDGLGTSLAVILPLLLLLLASLPLARWIYTRFVPEDQRWRPQDHRAFRVGVLWFVAASALHVLVLAGVALVASGASGPALGGWTLLAIQFDQALLGSLTGWCSVYLVGLGGTVLFRRNAMGFGDVKFLAPIGAFVGPVGVLWIFGLAALFGTVVGLPLRLLGGGRELPFGPYLALGAAVAVVAGPWLHELVFGAL